MALGPSEDPSDFTVSFYQSNGSVGLEITLDDPGVQVSVDPDNGEVVYVISADVFNILLTDPDGGGSNNYEAYALTNTDTNTVIDFYDIGGGTQNITASNGAAAGATSENIPVLVGPNSTTTTIQFNQPNPDQVTYETVAPGDTGIACFVAGTLIETANGPLRIEQLRPGDLVPTADSGPQPVSWVGSSVIGGREEFAPIRIKAGTLGAERDVFVSPQHRVLVTGWQAQLFFGEDEVLIPAKSLINGTTIGAIPCDIVRYVHVLFEGHQLVTTSGLVSESFYPGRTALNDMDRAAANEVFTLFPELRERDAWQAARPMCSGAEGSVLAIA